MKAYEDMREQLLVKVDILNAKGKDKCLWSAELLGRALWSKAVISSNSGGESKKKNTTGSAEKEEVDVIKVKGSKRPSKADHSSNSSNKKAKR
jgi:precorrin-6x reductase